MNPSLPPKFRCLNEAPTTTLRSTGCQPLSGEIADFGSRIVGHPLRPVGTWPGRGVSPPPRNRAFAPSMVASVTAGGSVRKPIGSMTGVVITMLAAVSCSHGVARKVNESSPGATASPIRAEGAWASSSGGRASVFFILSNHSSTDDALTGASSPIADNAVLKDRSKIIKRLPLPAGSEISFNGGRYGLTLTGLRRHLAVDGTVRVTLTFEHADPMTLAAGVR
jgi:periplasmic copper chaperone A